MVSKHSRLARAMGHPGPIMAKAKKPKRITSKYGTSECGTGLQPVHSFFIVCACGSTVTFAAANQRPQICPHCSASLGGQTEPPETNSAA